MGRLRRRLFHSISQTPQKGIRIEPTFTLATIPGGWVQLRAIIFGISSQHQYVDWYVENAGRDACGTIAFEPGVLDPYRHTMRYEAPSILSDAREATVVAQLMSDPSINGHAYITLWRWLIVGPQPRPGEIYEIENFIELYGLDVLPNPLQRGEFCKFFFTLRNLTDRDIRDIPWQIMADDYAIEMASGVKTVPAGAEVMVMVEVPGNYLDNLFPGPLRFTATVDPHNTLGESNEGQRNNQAKIVVDIFEYERQYLDPERALAAGAKFFRNYLNNGNWSEDPPDSRVRGGAYTSYEDNSDIMFWVSAPEPPFVTFYLTDDYRQWWEMFFPQTEEEHIDTVAEPEAYKDFELKNGWYVAAADIITCSDEEVGGSWDWVVRPNLRLGATRPYMRPRLTVRRGQITVFAKITIKGPRGTDPYQ